MSINFSSAGPTSPQVRRPAQPPDTRVRHPRSSDHFSATGQKKRSLNQIRLHDVLNEAIVKGCVTLEDEAAAAVRLP